MVISFFGHADFSSSENVENSIKKLFTKLKKVDKVEFYLSGYGAFSDFAYKKCVEFKNNHHNVKIIFITPYLDSYLENRKDSLRSLYDEIIFPTIENIPKKFAIIKRNEWIVDNSNLIVFYVNRSFGGASKVLTYANLAT